MNMRRIRFVLNWMGTVVLWAGVLSCRQAPEGAWALAGGRKRPVDLFEIDWFRFE